MRFRNIPSLLHYQFQSLYFTTDTSAYSIAPKIHELLHVQYDRFAAHAIGPATAMAAPRWRVVRNLSVGRARISTCPCAAHIKLCRIVDSAPRVPWTADSNSLTPFVSAYTRTKRQREREKGRREEEGGRDEGRGESEGEDQSPALNRSRRARDTKLRAAYWSPHRRCKPRTTTCLASEIRV